MAQEKDYKFDGLRVGWDEKHKGELWATDNAEGSVEVMHGWGRSVIMPVKRVYVNIYDDTIALTAICDDPILDGKARTGYHMPHTAGPFNKEFPGELIQTIIDVENLEIGNEKSPRSMSVTRTAHISMDKGKPVAVFFSCVEHAKFDVKEYIKELKSWNSIFSERGIEGLTGFDDMGFRQTTFKAVFSDNK